MSQVTAHITPAEMKRFGLALGELAKRSRGGVSIVIRKSFFDLMRDIMRLTPVRTGQARGGWMAAFDGLKMPAPSVGGGNPEGEALGRAASTARVNLPTPAESGGGLSLTTKANKPYAEVTNAVKHIIPLEFGRSRQAPQGMVRTTLRRHARHYIQQLRKIQ